MTVKMLVLQCDCGRSSSRVRKLGLTADRELLLTWVCPECKRQSYELMPLADCWRACPSTEDDEAGDVLDGMLQTAMHAVNEKDAMFLRSLGVDPL